MTFPKTLIPGFYDSSLSLIAISFSLLFVIYRLRTITWKLTFDVPAREMKQNLIFSTRTRVNNLRNDVLVASSHFALHLSRGIKIKGQI